MRTSQSSRLKVPGEGDVSSFRVATTSADLVAPGRWCRLVHMMDLPLLVQGRSAVEAGDIRCAALGSGDENAFYTLYQYN